MTDQRRPGDRILDRYLEKMNEKTVQEIVVQLKNFELSEYKEQIPKAKYLTILVESGYWKKHNTNYDIRFDNRPASQGGPQLHIKDRRGIEWAYRDNGGRSEKSKYTAPSTKGVQDIVRTYFKLAKDVKIESFFVGFSEDNSQLLLEARFER